MPIPLKTISHAIRKFAEIQRQIPGVSIEVEPENFWVGSNNEWHLVPRFGNVTDVPTLALICETCQWYVPHRSLTAETQNLPLFLNLATGESIQQVKQTHTSMVQSSVKYYYETARNFSTHGFGVVVPMLITSAPTELQANGKSFRVVSGQALTTNGDGYVRDANVTGRMHFAVSTDSPLYNYMDRGHVVFFVSKAGEEPGIFIANQLSLNVYSMAALFAVAPERVKPLLRNDVFLNASNSGELQRILLAAERGVPEKYGQRYAQLKATIRADFETNAQNVIVTKFQRGEIKEVTLNSIKLSANRATYETLSIEAEGLTDVILNKLDPNGVFDIYQLVDAFIVSIIEEMAQVPRSTTSQGFAEARQWTFRINDIPITVGLSTTNTRRRVNNHLINADELQKVIRRATCYTNAEQFNLFVRQVEKASLRVHDALANGVPLKIFVFDRRQDYHRPVTTKHPKIFFVCEKGKYSLWLNKEKTIRVPLRRFVGMLDEIQTLNARTNDGWVNDDSGITRRNSDWCKWKLKRIIMAHAIDDKDQPLVTEKDLDPLVEWLLEARSEAEKKSALLLASVVKEVGAKEVKYNGMEAYEVVGASGASYTVEKESFKVWKTGTSQYVCIVDGRAEMGVGYDALVTRLMALKNDTLVVDRIGTLREHVRNAKQTATATATPA